MPRPARRSSDSGFVLTLEFMLVLVLFVLPLLLAVLLLVRRTYTLYANDQEFLNPPDSQALVMDSSSATRPTVLGGVIGWDPFEAPLLIYRDMANTGGVALGVRGDRLTSYGEVYYDDAACTLNPRLRAASGLTTSNGNIPTGFLYQDFGAGYAMGSGNILYKQTSAPVSLGPGVGSRWLAMAATLGDAWDEALGWLGTLRDDVRDWGMLAMAWFEMPLQAVSGTYYVTTGHTGAQTQIDIRHTTSWYITVYSGTTLSFGGADLTMKRGSSTTVTATFTLMEGGPGGAVLGTKSLTSASFTTSFASVAFHFASPLSLAPGVYYATLTSTAPDVQSQAYFIKGKSGSTLANSSNHQPLASEAILGIGAETANFIISKTATSAVNTSGTIQYTIGIGNTGGAPSGTSATVLEQLPAGVVATAVAASSGVSAANCGSLPSAPGSLLTCTLTLTAGLASNAPAGSAQFLITATAPASVSPDPTTLTNYASVDATGGASPPTPGPTCATADCASAPTVVTSAGLPANLTIRKTGPSTWAPGDTLTYTLTIGNDGGTTSGMGWVEILDLIPDGVVVTSYSGGTNVDLMTCAGSPPYTGTLDCAILLTNGIAAGDTSGATVTLTATAPGAVSSELLTNYASVDAAAGLSAPTPGPLCLTTSCSSSTAAYSVVVGYVWRSQSIGPPTAVAPVPPCYAITSLPVDLVTATKVIDFDAPTEGNYVPPFRVFFRTSDPAPPLPSPNGEGR